MSAAHFGIILPAAGSGTRFGGSDKLFSDLGGQSVLQRSLALFAGRADVSHIVMVTSPDRITPYQQHVSAFNLQPSAFSIIAGGAQRWQSVLNGLRHLAALAAPPLYVGIHDAARPLCPAEVINAAFAMTLRKGAALPCLPEPATLKRRGLDGNVMQTVDRANLFQAQTPQCFTLLPLLHGYEQLVAQDRAGDLTDDAQVYERIPLPVPITAGSAMNLKITLAEDLALAMALLRESASGT